MTPSFETASPVKIFCAVFAAVVVMLKKFQGLFYIPVYFPKSSVLIIFSLVLYKPQYIGGRVSKEKTYFVGEIRTFKEPGLEHFQIGLRGSKKRPAPPRGGIRVTKGAEQLTHIRFHDKTF
jgi:hypothetical protein